MRTKKTYESAVHLFNKHNCNILDSKEEFDEVYKNGDSEVNYIASCGHNNSIKVRYFNGICGVICPNCVYTDTYTCSCMFTST
jgi:hypothetical protein